MGDSECMDRACSAAQPCRQKHSTLHAQRGCRSTPAFALSLTCGLPRTATRGLLCCCCWSLLLLASDGAAVVVASEVSAGTSLTRNTTESVLGGRGRGRGETAAAAVATAVASAHEAASVRHPTKAAAAGWRACATGNGSTLIACDGLQRRGIILQVGGELLLRSGSVRELIRLLELCDAEDPRVTQHKIF